MNWVLTICSECLMPKSKNKLQLYKSPTVNVLIGTQSIMRPRRKRPRAREGVGRMRQALFSFLCNSLPTDRFMELPNVKVWKCTRKPKIRNNTQLYDDGMMILHDEHKLYWLYKFVFWWMIRFFIVRVESLLPWRIELELFNRFQGGCNLRDLIWLDFVTCKRAGYSERVLFHKHFVAVLSNIINMENHFCFTCYCTYDF